MEVEGAGLIVDNLMARTRHTTRVNMPGVALQDHILRDGRRNLVVASCNVFLKEAHLPLPGQCETKMQARSSPIFMKFFFEPLLNVLLFF